MKKAFLISMALLAFGIAEAQVPRDTTSTDRSRTQTDRTKSATERRENMQRDMDRNTPTMRDNRINNPKTPTTPPVPTQPTTTPPPTGTTPQPGTVPPTRRP